MSITIADQLVAKRKQQERLLRALGKTVCVDVEVPSELENFLSTDAEWCHLPTKSEHHATTVYFWAPKGYVFDKHYHLEDETILVVGGRLRVTAYGKDYVVNTGESIKINRDTTHSAVWEEDSSLIISWHPPLKNRRWVGKFETGGDNNEDVT